LLYRLQEMTGNRLGSTKEQVGGLHPQYSAISHCLHPRSKADDKTFWSNLYCFRPVAKELLELYLWRESYTCHTYPSCTGRVHLVHCTYHLHNRKFLHLPQSKPGYGLGQENFLYIIPYTSQ